MALINYFIAVCTVDSAHKATEIKSIALCAAEFNQRAILDRILLNLLHEMQ
ncbi:hypothetical protein [Paenibacillus sp. IHBB 3054]|uniref:hypothetical protein n=1 Tax=Paenibacillus sp. IHBB 3054 TaxID=3425689 RepID=UPI003F6811F1